jgi:hypothetical protein
MTHTFVSVYQYNNSIYLTRQLASNTWPRGVRLSRGVREVVILLSEHVFIFNYKVSELD